MRSKWGLVYLCLFFWSTTAFAVDFSGTSTGIFTNPVGPVGMVTTGVDTNYFTWGNPGGFGTGPSSLNFNGTSFSGDYNSTEFSFGTLSYFNGTINPGSEATSVNLEVNLAFTTPTGVNQDFVFPFQLINVPNSGTPTQNADYVYLNDAFNTEYFFTDNLIEYTLEFTRFGNIGVGGFIDSVDQFFVLEGSSASADIFGRITSSPGVNPVPEPSTFLLLGGGLIGLAFAVRRRRKE